MKIKVKPINWETPYFIKNFWQWLYGDSYSIFKDQNNYRFRPDNIIINKREENYD